jgi:hypothetical protein
METDKRKEVIFTKGGKKSKETKPEKENESCSRLEFLLHSR